MLPIMSKHCRIALVLAQATAFAKQGKVAYIKIRSYK